jgi:ATP-dependent HslUV protease, peptidase subunit HslV
MKTRSTTILAVRRDGVTAIAGDGQITVGDVISKSKTVKLRKMREGKVVTGYAGAAADALALYERLEAKLDEYSGNVQRAAVELVKQWRMDRALRRLEALLVVADKDNLLLISGTGDVIVPDDDVIGIGSGGPFAQAAALAMLKHTDMPAPEIAREAVLIASQICIYTNDNITVEVLQ